MPQKYVIKRYYPDMYYHVFNRVANGMLLCPQAKDYSVFKKYLKETLIEFSGRIYIRYGVIMPTHYHFSLWQKDDRDMTLFLRSFLAKYSAYYRKKYGSRGRIYESAFKARPLPYKDDVIRIDEYIRMNPLSSGLRNWEHFVRGEKITGIIPLEVNQWWEDSSFRFGQEE